MKAVPILLALLFIAPAASAHSSSNSYLSVANDGATLHVQWEIAIRDLDDAIGVDDSGTGVVTWGELRGHHAAIADYARSHLAVTADGAACAGGKVDHLVDRHGDGAYAVLRFDMICPAVPRRLTIRYTALFDQDAQHRGLMNLIANGGSRAAVFSPDAQTQSFDVHINLIDTFLAFYHAGIAHILGGWDHLLFIAMLLTPVAFGRNTKEKGIAWKGVIAILSAFTIAHAISLATVALGYIEVPARLIEGAIALTIVATALDNIVPFLGERRWPAAFGFGLIHGLGFASSLGPLTLPPLGLALALGGFNLGVETAQLIAVAAVVPLGYLARHRGWRIDGLVPIASGATAVLALAWYIGRTFGPWTFGPWARLF